MKKLLFVCLGNICRSPTAEAVMVELIKKHGRSDAIQCDSAGTAGYHIGELADERTRRMAESLGYHITHRARQFDSTRDFTEFDYILTMDDKNFKDITRMSRNAANASKVLKFADFLSTKEYSEIPDPYYGGEHDFKLVVDLCEDAAYGLLQFINERI